jgi:hypothetical protein
VKDISRLRKRIDNLDRERRKLQGFLLRPQDMLYGSFYQIYRSCGNPNCHCRQGEKHPAKCLSTRQAGKTKLVYVRKEDESWVERQARNYQRFQNRIAQIRKINNQIFELLKSLRDPKLKRYK